MASWGDSNLSFQVFQFNAQFMSPPSFDKVTIRAFSSRAVKTQLDRASGSPFCCICCFFHGHSQALTKHFENNFHHHKWGHDLKNCNQSRSSFGKNLVIFWSGQFAHWYAIVASSELFSGNPMWRLSGYITHTGLFWGTLRDLAGFAAFGFCHWVRLMSNCNWGHHMTSWGNSSLSFSSFSVLCSIYEPCHFWPRH